MVSELLLHMCERVVIAESTDENAVVWFPSACFWFFCVQMMRNMKIGIKKFPVLSALLVSCLAAANAGFAQQTLTVSPSSTSNTYTGVVTLNITGLTNGEKVSIEKWLDLNTNGSIDAGDLLVDAFKITDNDLTNNLIGGVMDISVPWDTNSTNGAITTTLNFAGNMAIENMTAHFIYRLVSPTGRFAPVTALFTVTNATQAQSVSGHRLQQRLDSSALRRRRRLGPTGG